MYTYMYDLASKVLYAMATVITDLQIGVLYHAYKYIKCMYENDTSAECDYHTIHTNFRYV